MSETSLRNTDIDAALNEAKEAYVTGAPAQPGALCRGDRR